MMGFGLLGTILVIILVTFLLVWRPQSDRNFFMDTHQPQSPLDILKTRYARGEINQEEFERMRDELRYS